MSVQLELARLVLRFVMQRRGGPTVSVETARARLATLSRLSPGPPHGTRKEWVDAGGVRAIRVATGRSRADRHVLYLHGGGYVAGSPALYRDLVWRIADACHAQCLCTDYRLAPEHPYPAALDDAVAAYRWLLLQGALPAHVALMGESAGGGLVIGTLLKLRDEGVPLPGAAVALSPWTDLAMTGSSVRTNAAKDVMIRADEMTRIAGYYLAGADPHTPYASPHYGNLAGLPPTLIQVGDEEVLLDDAVRLAERMRAAGCEVTLEVWPRVPHGWQAWARVMPEARRAIARIGAFVQEKC